METGNVWDVKMGGKSCERSEGATHMIYVTRGSHKTMFPRVLSVTRGTFHSNDNLKLPHCQKAVDAWRLRLQSHN
jgi:hypothetical protein